MSKNQARKNLDSDNDGLSDEDEIKFYKTNPYKADTDGDGVDDGLEIALGRNPRGAGLWQDLFIPNHYNNYKPKVLHPHRIFFYSLSAVAIKVMVIVLALSFPIQAWLTPNLLAEQSQRIVEATNNLRASLNVNPLDNSAILQQAALAKTEDMLVNQYFAHISPDNKGLKYWLAQASYNYQVAGENLALGFSEPDEVLQAWQKSPTHYANLIDPDFKEIGVAMVSGNYQGYDTTLVAQYFGAKNILQDKITSTADLITIMPDENLNSNTNNQVLSNKDQLITVPIVPVKTDVVVVPEPSLDSKPLVAPVLLSPANNFVTKNNTISLLISAPAAEQVSVWSSDVLLKTVKLSSEQDLKIDIDLIDGKHQIVIEATKGESKVYSPIYNLEVDKQAPILDQALSSIATSQPVGQDDLLLKVDAYLSPDTLSAQVKLSNYKIDLQRDENDPNHWTGHLIIADENKAEISDPLLLASLTATDQLGNISTTDISWSSIPPAEPSPIKQYLFVKNNNSAYITPLFDISLIYYKIILVLAVFSLLLNIFIEIKKQHPKTIASTMGFIALLVLLIIF